ncbi:MAG TPA: PQQ-binding-like beta-propeller repeat protein [Tepidisphaeraceae bacterium]|nr:PQQ-binding-like beta-propeller repeat protein [Tepidisphaeraceae bacterium]
MKLPVLQTPLPARSHAFSKCLLLAAIFMFLVPLARADTPANWPRWRGPHDDGSNDIGTYPVKWDANTNLLWKIALPGKGCSTPIVQDGRILLTAPADGQDAVLAYDWAGKTLWQTTIGVDRKGQHQNGSGCNPSPATDGKNVFVYFKSGDLAGLTLDGKLLWKTNLQQRFGKDTLYWDLGTSPVLTEKDVIIAVMHHGGSYLAAFDKLTGDLHWKVARDYPTPDEGDHSYATPIVYREAGKESILVWGGQHLTSHDSADGSILWTVGDFNPQSHSNWVVVASAMIAGDMAIVPYGRGSCVHGIKLGGTGDMTATNRIWKREDTGCFVPSPAAYKGKVYLLRDRGEIECLDPATGKKLWSGALPKGHSSYYSSPALADGKIYAAREDGTVFVARVAGEQGGFEVLSANDMGERIIAAPVPVANKLLIRGEGHLFCVGAE